MSIFLPSNELIDTQEFAQHGSWRYFFNVDQRLTNNRVDDLKNWTMGGKIAKWYRVVLITSPWSSPRSLLEGQTVHFILKPAWQHLRNQTCHFIDSKYDADENGGADNLAALHRSYKMMENDKVRYMEESKNIIKRQTQVDSLPPARFPQLLLCWCY